MIHTYPKDDFKREANILRSFFNDDIYDLLQRLDAMVAGGTLTSLFSNREVNDLDIYFRTWDDMEIFITYLHDNDLRSGDHDLSVHTNGWNKYKRTYRRFKEMDGVELADHPVKISLSTTLERQGFEPVGGKLTVEKLHELSQDPVFMGELRTRLASMKTLQPYNEDEEMESSYVKVLGMTDKSVMYSNRSGPVMQLIGFDVFSEPVDIFKKFDFTINMGAFCFQTEDWHFDVNFMKHIAQKVLVVNPDTDYPIISLLRASKYQARGYTISRRETMKLGLSTSKLSIESWDDAKKHLSGMYGTNVETLFNEQRPFSFDLLFDKLDSAGDAIISHVATDREKGDRSKINSISLVPKGHFTVLNNLRYHTGRPHYSKMWGVCKSKSFYLLEPEKREQKVHVGMTDVNEHFHQNVELYFEEKDAKAAYDHLESKGGAVLLQVDILEVKNLHQHTHDRGSVNMDVNNKHVKRTTPSAVIKKYISSNGDFT